MVIYIQRLSASIDHLHLSSFQDNIPEASSWQAPGSVLQKLLVYAECRDMESRSQGLTQSEGMRESFLEERDVDFWKVHRPCSKLSALILGQTPGLQACSSRLGLAQILPTLSLGLTCWIKVQKGGNLGSERNMYYRARQTRVWILALFSSPHTSSVSILSHFLESSATKSPQLLISLDCSHSPGAAF